VWSGVSVDSGIVPKRIYTQTVENIVSGTKKKLITNMKAVNVEVNS